MNLLWLSLAALIALTGKLVDCKPALLNESGTPRIIGGQDAYDGEFPYHLELEYFGSLGWKHQCGAVLLSVRYALTGAKCVSNANTLNLRLYAGLLIREDYEATNAQQISISNVKLHEDYDEYVTSIPNDIAILRFSWDADLTRPNIAVATLPPDSSIDFTAAQCTVIGWGRVGDELTLPWVLQKLDIPVITNTLCEEMQTGVNNNKIWDNQICVYSDTNAIGPCQGDSGSPLVCVVGEGENQTTYVAGIGSWTTMVNGNCNLYFPSVYGRVSEFLDWISANTPPLA